MPAATRTLTANPLGSHDVTRLATQRNGSAASAGTDKFHILARRIQSTCQFHTMLALAAANIMVQTSDN